MAKKRTLDSFFETPTQKKRHTEVLDSTQGALAADRPPQSDLPPSNHSTYPFPVPQLPSELTAGLSSIPAVEGKVINDQPDLDLLYFQPYIGKGIEKDYFEFLRGELFFYRVQYKIKRGPVETQINTPRFTTVFGVDDTSRFTPEGLLVDSQTSKPIPSDRYKNCRPRSIPQCLDDLRKITEIFTDSTYNFCLVNYYATGSDSISYHSDDERFLGTNPSIASLSLGAKRDFLMKHKPIPPSASTTAPSATPLKLPLASGDMVLMRGRTQSNWLHSIPKRKGGESDRGRINITFRKAMVRGGTENYYNYNVGSGAVYKWDPRRQEMMPWQDTK